MSGVMDFPLVEVSIYEIVPAVGCWGIYTKARVVSGDSKS